jgi:ABC-type transporter Mla subunit MlaD
MTDDESQDLEHLRAVLESQAKQIENLQRLAKDHERRLERLINRNFELRTELAKFVRADNPVLRGKKK